MISKSYISLSLNHTPAFSSFPWNAKVQGIMMNPFSVHWCRAGLWEVYDLTSQEPPHRRSPQRHHTPQKLPPPLSRPPLSFLLSPNKPPPQKALVHSVCCIVSVFFFFFPCIIKHHNCLATNERTILPPFGLMPALMTANVLILFSRSHRFELNKILLISPCDLQCIVALRFFLCKAFVLRAEDWSGWRWRLNCRLSEAWAESLGQGSEADMANLDLLCPDRQREVEMEIKRVKWIDWGIEKERAEKVEETSKMDM